MKNKQIPLPLKHGFYLRSWLGEKKPNNHSYPIDQKLMKSRCCRLSIFQDTAQEQNLYLPQFRWQRGLTKPIRAAWLVRATLHFRSVPNADDVVGIIRTSFLTGLLELLMISLWLVYRLKYSLFTSTVVSLCLCNLLPYISDIFSTKSITTTFYQQQLLQQVHGSVDVQREHITPDLGWLLLCPL